MHDSNIECFVMSDITAFARVISKLFHAPEVDVPVGEQSVALGTVLQRQQSPAALGDGLRELLLRDVGPHLHVADGALHYRVVDDEAGARGLALQHQLQRAARGAS